MPSRRSAAQPAAPVDAADPAPAPRRQRLAPEARASQILDVAARLLLEEGFTEVSMERLGREAGISKGLVYNYFPSRNELLVALLARESSALREAQATATAEASDFRDRVRRTTRLYIEHIQQRGPLLRKLWAEPAVARAFAGDQRRGRDEAMRYFANTVSREYGLPREVAISAVDMQMGMTEEAAQHVLDSHGSVDFATEICVTLLFGGLEALAREYGKPVVAAMPATPAKPAPAPARKRARRGRLTA